MSTIEGAASTEESGTDIELSGDGRTIIINGPGYDNGGTNNVGRARIFRYNGTAWAQIGNILGESTNDYTSASVSINYEKTCSICYKKRLSRS